MQEEAPQLLEEEMRWLPWCSSIFLPPPGLSHDSFGELTGPSRGAQPGCGLSGTGKDGVNLIGCERRDLEPETVWYQGADLKIWKSSQE